MQVVVCICVATQVEWSMASLNSDWRLTCFLLFKTVIFQARLAHLKLKTYAGSCVYMCVHIHVYWEKSHKKVKKNYLQEDDIYKSQLQSYLYVRDTWNQYTSSVQDIYARLMRNLQLHNSISVFKHTLMLKQKYSTANQHQKEKGNSRQNKKL